MSAYAPGSAPRPAAKQAQNGGIIYRGRWANSAGWTGRHMWTGRIRRYDPPTRLRVVKDAEGNVDLARSMASVARAKVPAHLNRVRHAPEIVFVPLEADYAEALQKGWKDASELTAEHREMILDCYGDDLTPTMREICAEQIRERDAKARRAAAAATPRRDTTPPAGRGATTKPKPRKQR